MLEKKLNLYDFHDNALHGVAFCVEDFKSELRLDIDHIVTWPDCLPGEKGHQFGVARAFLKFHDVTDLSIKIDWGSSGFTTSVSGMYIDKIEREEISTSLRLPHYYSWTVLMSDEQSVITFGASSFELDSRGFPITVPRQFLKEEERNKLI